MWVFQRWNKLLEPEDGIRMYECFHCLSRSVIWDSDFSFEDYGMYGDGIVQVCHCTNCGAMITYYIPLDEEAEETVASMTGEESGA